jgi:hypothetical protein
LKKNNESIDDRINREKNSTINNSSKSIKVFFPMEKIPWYIFKDTFDSLVLFPINLM